MWVYGGRISDDVAPTAEPRVVLPPPTVGEDIRTDYATTGTTLGPHLLKLLRGRLQARRCRSSTDWRVCRTARLCATPAWCA